METIRHGAAAKSNHGFCLAYQNLDLELKTVRWFAKSPNMRVDQSIDTDGSISHWSSNPSAWSIACSTTGQRA
jgi:hypothetical protein